MRAAGNREQKSNLNRWLGHLHKLLNFSEWPRLNFWSIRPHRLNVHLTENVWLEPEYASVYRLPYPQCSAVSIELPTTVPRSTPEPKKIDNILQSIQDQVSVFDRNMGDSHKTRGSGYSTFPPKEQGLNDLG